MAHSLDLLSAVHRLIDIAAGYALGIGLGLLSPGPWNVAWAVAGFMSLGMLCGGPLGRLAVLLGAAVCGYARVPQEEAPPLVEPLPCQQVVIAEALEESTTVMGQERGRLRIVAASDCVTSAAPPSVFAASGRLSLTVAHPLSPHLPQGALVRLHGRVNEVLLPRNPGMPHVELDVLSMTIPTRAHLTILARAAPSPSSWLSFARQRLERHFDSVLAPSEAGLARALTLGQGRAVLPEARLAFRRTGTAHLLAVSGLNLSFATLIALGVLSFWLARIPWLARRFDTGKFAAAGAIAAAGAYACLSGADLPVTRAFVMLATVLSGRLCHRPASSSSGLALAVLSILLPDPTSLCEPSFQLSFGAAAALVFFLARRSTGDDSEQRPTGMRARWLEALAQLFRVSLAATAVTTPIALWHFRELSLVAVPVNLIAVPIASLVLVPGLLVCCVLVPIWPAAAVLVTRGCGALVGLFTDCLEALSKGPIAIAEPGFAVSACAVTACAAAALVAMWPRRSSALVLGLACGACGLSLIVSTDSPPRDALVLDALDVGHGDSLLLTLPTGEHILVDTGGSRDPAYDTGERIVVPALRSLGVSSLAALVLTHEDHDHVGGARAVLRGLTPLQLWHNGAASPGDAQAAAVAGANSSGALVAAPPSLCGLHRIGNATITVLHPCDVVPSIGSGGNDRSLVLLVEHEASRLLLLGDVGAQVERDLVNRGLVPPVDVLKVAHHGSKTSTSDELLAAASPRYALVSEPRHAGRIGLHRDTAQRLESAGAILLSTGKRGALRIVLDGRGIAVRPL